MKNSALIQLKNTILDEIIFSSNRQLYKALFDDDLTRFKSITKIDTENKFVDLFIVTEFGSIIFAAESIDGVRKYY